jgi:hypothetical protein
MKAKASQIIIIKFIYIVGLLNVLLRSRYLT